MAAAKGNRYAAKYDNGEMDKICEKLLHWAEHSKSIHFASFCRKELKKSKKWLRETAEHYPKLAETIEEAREILSAKIVDSCFRDKESGVNATFGSQYLPIYDDDFKTLLEWKANNAKKDLTKEDAELIINVMNYAKSPKK